MIKLYRPALDIKCGDKISTYYAPWATLSHSFKSQSKRLMEFKNKAVFIHSVNNEIDPEDIDTLDVDIRYIELKFTPLSDIWNRICTFLSFGF